MQPLKSYKRGIDQKGFSLVELMVAMTIFSIVMTIGMGTLLVLIDANSKAQALSTAMTNLSFAIDSMTRNMRTGQDFYCVNGSSLEGSTLPPSTTVDDCLSGKNAIVFTPGFATSTRMAYRLEDNKIEQWIDKPGSDTWVAITSDQPPSAVVIDRLQFVVSGSNDTEAPPGTVDDKQPKLALTITGFVQNGLASSTAFQVQSQVVQRLLDY